MSHLNIKMTDDRHDRIRRLMEATGENTKSKAIDTAVKHYLTDLRNKEDYIDSMDRGTVEALSTPYIRLERQSEVYTG